MNPLSAIAGVLATLVNLYVVVLFARLVLEWIPVFNREWRPKGAMLVVAEFVYTITDPPIRFFRRIIKPLRVGGAVIDFAFAFTMLSCFVLVAVLRMI